jgi:hypothetical protein
MYNTVHGQLGNEEDYNTVTLCYSKMCQLIGI